ncbi:cytidylyltransferase domain-containing protein [Zobellia laminariae]|uniref:cytidylyltransferase domain-containing protein n=1 Tax=Zobellia laminariae TaxID=248906 RepID=UPI0012D8C52E|nr:spore coat protein [Zobellia laminariae]
MEDGHQSKKAIFIIQARMQSSRLPGKVLIPLPLWGDKQLLMWVIEELRKSKHYGKIVLATSKNKENDLLEDFCSKNSIACFRGEEDDVLSRFTSILKDVYYNTVVRLTADNPIIDINTLDKTISYHQAQGNDYTNTDTLPTGMNFEVVKAQSLLEITNQALTLSDREHVTLFIRNNKKYKKGVFNPTVSSFFKTLRLTVDYASDLLVTSSLLQFGQKHQLRGLELVQAVYTKAPYLFEANKNNIQKRQFKDAKMEVDFAIQILQKYELHTSASILEKQKP